MKNVLLVFGGESYEHDISIVSACQIFNKTRIDDVNLVPLYISKSNRFFVYRNNKFELSDFANFDETKIKKQFKEVVFVSSENGKLFSKSLFGLKEYLKSSVAIFACHGGDGENGQLVSYFEKFGIFSTAGSIDGLGISMNKLLFKAVMKGFKIPVVSGFAINKNDYQNNKTKFENKLRFFKFPLILKPCSGGSSIGLFIAKNKEEFKKKLISVFEFDETVLVEKFISSAREFNVAVLGDKNDFLISEIDEPLKISEVLTFEEKYLAGQKTNKSGQKLDGAMVSQKRKFPADLDDVLRTKIKTIASEVCSVLNLSGVVRIDFLYDEKHNKVYVCEVNAIPGSLSYYFFERGKVLINDFVLKLIEIAENKQNNKKTINNEFVTKILN